MPFSLQILLVAIGGAFGAVSRYVASGWVNKTFLFGHGVPVGTLSVNVIGSALMGVLYVFTIERGLGSAALKPLLMAGFLGAFTTFSAFSLELVNMLEQGHWLESGLFLVANVLLSVLAFAAALYVMRLVV